VSSPAPRFVWIRARTIPLATALGVNWRTALGLWLVLALTVDHLVCDAWSVQVLADEPVRSFETTRAEAENLNKQQSLAMRDLRKASALAPDAKTRQSIGMAIASLSKAMHHK